MTGPSIDLTGYSAKVYVGKSTGRKARTHFDIERLEHNANFPIHVIMPMARTMSVSFFEGMFGMSVLKAGSRDEFNRRYIFTAGDQVKAEVAFGIKELLSRDAKLNQHKET